VVPKGFVRTLGKLAEIKDSGIPIYFFVGNHDLWMKDYFEEELNIPVYHQPKEFEFNRIRNSLLAMEMALVPEITATKE
jgi:UDP-2,3-diacylglucosamine hydrolase